MPDARLKRTRATLPEGYQFGDAAVRSATATKPARLPAVKAPAHPHRLAGSHDGLYVTEHHRGAKK